MTDGPLHALVRKIPRSYVGYYARQGTTVDVELADRQHQGYVRALQTAGLTVSVVEPEESLPDCVFVEDTAVVWNQHFLVTCMCAAREGEQATVEAILRQTHSVTRLPPRATLDGGDVLHIGDISYVGLSSRTNELGADCLTDFLGQFGRRVVKVPVANCLHLKTGATYLGNGTLLAVPGWFDMTRFEVDAVIDTQPGENGAANCLRIRDHLLIPDGYPQTALRLQAFAGQHGVRITRLGISEFEKGDGSLTCLSIIW